MFLYVKIFLINYLFKVHVLHSSAFFSLLLIFLGNLSRDVIDDYLQMRFFYVDATECSNEVFVFICA